MAAVNKLWCQGMGACVCVCVSQQAACSRTLRTCAATRSLLCSSCMEMRGQSASQQASHLAIVDDTHSLHIRSKVNLVAVLCDDHLQ